MVHAHFNNTPSLWSVHRIIRVRSLCAIATFLFVSFALLLDPTHAQLPNDFPTLMDKIPNFARQPTIQSAQSGTWGTASTWIPARIPQPGDVVLIRHTVTYNTTTGNVDTVGINNGGILRFSVNSNTKLRVGTLLVMPGGTLEVGTEQQPVQADKTAEILIANKPLDLTNDGVGIFDPEQYGTGLLAIDGTVTMSGAPKAPTFVRLTTEPKAGHTTLSTAQSVLGWRAGDTVLLPDSRQLLLTSSQPNYWWQTTTQWEERVVQSIGTQQLTVTQALAFTHPGARDGGGTLDVDFLPHVANLTRNVIIRSENPSGTRGHTFFTHHSRLDMQYVLLQDLGRTTVNALDNTTFGSNGNVTHIGTNQVGRYALHLHHLIGPSTNPIGGEHQYRLVGNVIKGGQKWGLAIHDTHYGLIRDNIVYNIPGSGLVLEDGTESYNHIEQNFVVRTGSSVTTGVTSAGDPGLSSGFWLRSINNYVRDNVVANADFVGFIFYPKGVGEIKVPAFPGQHPPYTVTFHANKNPILQFDRNEVYGITNTALLFWYVSDADTAKDLKLSPTIVRDFKAWHLHKQGFNAYYSAYLVLDGWTLRGDIAQLPKATNIYARPLAIGFGRSTPFIVTITNADIQNFYTGIALPARDKDHDVVFTVEDSYLRNYVNITRTADGTRGPLIIRDTPLPLANTVTLSSGPKLAIELQGTGGAGRNTTVDGYNGHPSDDFRVFFLGGATPCTATRPEIRGYVCP